MANKILELEDGSNFLVVDEAKIDNTNYVYLVNEDNKKDILFQRINYENRLPILSGIKTDEEFDVVLKYFGEKYKKLLESF